MNAFDLRNILNDCCNDISFNYNGHNSGIFPEVKNSVKKYSLWYGDFHKDYSDVDTLMSDKVFDGKSLCDICASLRIDVE